MFTRITPATTGRGVAVAMALCLTSLARGQETPKQPTPAPKVNSELGIVGEPPIKSPRPLVDVSANLSDTIALLPQDPRIKTRDVVPFPSIFHREMARQSFWMAAHDDFGLHVRDSSLGEAVPEGLPADRQFRFQQAPFTNEPWTVTVGEHRLWAGQFMNDFPGGRMWPWIDISEKRSRTFARASLEAAGFKAKPVRKSNAPVPQAIQERLGKMRETDQFAAVRLLHAEIAAQGESDALIEALAQAYAHLGLLTEHHWNPAPMVFKARSLLYAQRLANRHPESANAIRLRAYAFALAGVHDAALLDLDHAAKLKDKPPSPAWLEQIDAYLHFDKKRLAAARAKSDTSLVRLFQYLIDEEPYTATCTIASGRKLLEMDPEIYRVHDGLCRVGGVSHLHAATVEGIRVYLKNLPDRLREQPGLPKTVLDSLDENEAAVYAALFAAGANDTGEPSWSTLGTLLREVRFAQSVQRLDFMSRKLAVSTTEAAKELRDLFVDHPLRSFVETYELSPYESPQALQKKLAAVPARDLDIKADAYFHRYEVLDRIAANNWFTASGMRPEPFYFSQAHIARSLNPTIAAQTRTGTRLKDLSPHSPRANAMYLAEAKPEYEQQYPELEKQFADHALFQKTLAERYVATQKRDDAVRCLTRWLELSPDLAGFQRLAEIYKAKGDAARWQETLESALQTEDIGLNHAFIRVQLANEFIGKRDFKKAEPYAQAAAGTGAEWALHCFANCKIGLGQFDEANELYQAAAERYPSGSPFDWYLACRATGKMDRNAAEKSVQAVLGRVGERLPQRTAFKAGCYYLAAGKKEKALAAYQRENVLSPSALTWMFTAFTADSLGDAKSRDAAFQSIQKLPGEEGYKIIAKAVGEWQMKEEPPAEEAFRAISVQLSPVGKVDAEFYYGWYLQNRGFTGRALVHWKRCHEAPESSSIIRTQAETMLREHSTNDPKEPK